MWVYLTKHEYVIDSGYDEIAIAPGDYYMFDRPVPLSETVEWGVMAGIYWSGDAIPKDPMLQTYLITDVYEDRVLLQENVIEMPDAPASNWNESGYVAWAYIPQDVCAPDSAYISIVNGDQTVEIKSLCVSAMCMKLTEYPLYKLNKLKFGDMGLD